MRSTRVGRVSALALTLIAAAPPTAPAPTPPLIAPDPLDALTIYPGEWKVRAAHPWSGADPAKRGENGDFPTDRLSSRCQHFAAYVACEQTINLVPKMLIVYTRGEPDKDGNSRLNTRFIDPKGLAGARGEMAMAGNVWTYTDKPPAGLTGNWSRTVNTILSRDHIRFEEYESADEGKTWQLTNQGDEWRMPG